MVWQGFFKKNLELQVKSNDAVLKNKILVLNGTELLAFDKKRGR